MTLRVLIAAGTLQFFLFILDVTGETWKGSVKPTLHEGARNDQGSKVRLSTPLSPLGIIFGILGCLAAFVVCFSCYTCLCRRRNRDLQVPPEGMSQPQLGRPITAGVMPPIYGKDNMAFHRELPAPPWSQSSYYYQQQQQQQQQQYQHRHPAGQQSQYFPPHAYPPAQPYGPPHFVWTASAPPSQTAEPPPPYAINEVRPY